MSVLWCCLTSVPLLTLSTTRHFCMLSCRFGVTDCEVSLCLVAQRDSRIALVPCGHQRFCEACANDNNNKLLLLLLLLLPVVESSFEVLEFLLDEFFCELWQNLPADLQYYINWYINSMKCRPNPDPDPNPNPNPESFHRVKSRVMWSSTRSTTRL